MPSDVELVARLCLAVALGGVIGSERELADQPAGLRTHGLLALGSCLFTLVSAYAFGETSDPSRLAAQIVTGVGFLGGGAILRHGFSVRGLTTAASIWATAALGVAVGLGRYTLALSTTLLLLLTLVGLRTIRNFLRRYRAGREEFALVTDPEFRIEEAIGLLRREGVQLRGLERAQDDPLGRIVLLTRLPRRYQPERLVEELVSLKGVREVEWEE